MNFSIFQTQSQQCNINADSMRCCWMHQEWEIHESSCKQELVFLEQFSSLPLCWRLEQQGRKKTVTSSRVVWLWQNHRSRHSVQPKSGKSIPTLDMFLVSNGFISSIIEPHYTSNIGQWAEKNYDEKPNSITNSNRVTRDDSWIFFFFWGLVYWHFSLSFCV